MSQQLTSNYLRQISVVPDLAMVPVEELIPPLRCRGSLLRSELNFPSLDYTTGLFRTPSPERCVPISKEATHVGNVILLRSSAREYRDCKLRHWLV